MSDTLVDIQNHCFDFQNNTLGPMVSLGKLIIVLGIWVLTAF